MQTAFGEAFDEGIGADRAIHCLLAGDIQPPVYAFMDFSLKALRSSLDI